MVIAGNVTQLMVDLWSNRILFLQPDIAYLLA